MYRLSARPVDPSIGFPSAEHTPGAGRNIIWRFFADPNHQWRWQRLSVQGEVISESANSYKNFDGCVSAAEESGYMFRPAQPRKTSVAQTSP
jgi:hypothetical protein